MNDFWRTYGAFAVMLPLLGVAFFAGTYVGERSAEEAILSGVQDRDPMHMLGTATSSPVSFSPYWKVWDTLERKFVPFGTSSAHTVSSDDRLWRSIEGLVASYDDPYTVFFPPKQAEEFAIRAKGSFEGVGMVVGERAGQLVVVSPLENSPAARAGVRTGDAIVSIDGATTEGMTVDDAVAVIRGEGGSTVTIEVVHVGSSSPEALAVTRGSIEIPSTRSTVVSRDVPAPLRTSVATVTPSPAETPLGDDNVSAGGGTRPIESEPEQQDFFVLSLFNFSQTSIASFESQLREFQKSGADMLIVDLRGNPGGYLEAAVQIASWFLPEGEIVAREYSGPNQNERLYKSVGRTLGTDLKKMAVLVNKGSASASEILAAALQEHGVATVVGEQTFGKGSVQELVQITDDVSLKVTVARWYTPLGHSLSGVGLVPDISVVSMPTATSSDPVLDAALDYLLSGTSTEATVL